MQQEFVIQIDERGDVIIDWWSRDMAEIAHELGDDINGQFDNKWCG